MTVDLDFVVHARSRAARTGKLTVRGRPVTTPAFLPVGTYGTVRGMQPEQLAGLGAELILANACHLHDRPGADVVARLGGLHRVMGWDGALLTDSGGFQVFSMLDIARLDDEGVTFRSPVNGRPLRLGPIEAMDVQLALDSDIAMVFDHCPPLPADRELLTTAVRRTSRWAEIALEHHRSRNGNGQALFAIVQGGLDDDLRGLSAEQLTALPFDGFALGGLSVGEESDALQAAMARYAPLLPEQRLRYVMGIGHPADVVAAIAAGIDVFDCVLPSRNGRHGSVFTANGTVHLKNSRFREEAGPIDPECGCPTCARWSAGALRHFILAKEPLGWTLCTTHNLFFLHQVVEQARQAIHAGRFAAWAEPWLGWGRGARIKKTEEASPDPAGPRAGPPDTTTPP